MERVQFVPAIIVSEMPLFISNYHIKQRYFTDLTTQTKQIRDRDIVISFINVQSLEKALGRKRFSWSDGGGKIFFT